jgi:homoserine/homoserine lactone efflux protein
MEVSLLAFALMALLVTMTPGPTVLLALSNGTKFGFCRAGYGILGAAVSDGVLIIAAALGLGALLSASVFWFTVVKFIGAAYLVWIGVQMLRSSGTLGALPVRTIGTKAADPGGAAPLFRKSFLVAVTNPKGYLFFTALLPQFLNVPQPLWSQYFMLSLIFITVDVAVMAAYASLGAKAVQFLTDRGALWIDRTSGGFLIVFGIALASLRRGEV